MCPVDPSLHRAVSWCVYILRCRDGSLYIGHTHDLEWRMIRHLVGRGCKYTAARLPVDLVHSEVAPDRLAAIARERQLKRWTRAKKEALIAGNITLLKLL
jgi:predicted GIY-YIG superfamily endonuclease